MLKIMFMPKCLATYTEAFTVTTLRCFGKMIPLSGICYDCGQMGLLSRVVGLSSTGAKTDCPVLSLCRQRHKQKVTKGENSKQSYLPESLDTVLTQTVPERRGKKIIEMRNLKMLQQALQYSVV